MSEYLQSRWNDNVDLDCKSVGTKVYVLTGHNHVIVS